ncbi:hypothetical protein GCK32_003398 [Trichostrongylus colubriformis]|uniref:Uncharacterized protein n=1 Tax=Trichostrongylus colubriformis TaxID=6319 RepID=A0AAN8FCV5_TRICO
MLFLGNFADFLQDGFHKLNLANTEITQWKSKFDAEVALHHEEVEELRKNMLQKQAEFEEQIEIMLQKISQLEKAKSRLQSEVEVLIVDLEATALSHAILDILICSPTMKLL